MISEGYEFTLWQPYEVEQITGRYKFVVEPDPDMPGRTMFWFEDTQEPETLGGLRDLTDWSKAEYDAINEI